MFKKLGSLLGDLVTWNVSNLMRTLNVLTLGFTVSAPIVGIVLSVWGLVVLCRASTLLALICLLIQPTPFVIGLLTLFQVDGAAWLQAHLHLPL
jgi:hypothetical protein